MKLSVLLATGAWLSTFALAWLIIMNKVQSSMITWFFFGFFTIVAFLASVTAAEFKKRSG